MTIESTVLKNNCRNKKMVAESVVERSGELNAENDFDSF